MSNKAKKPLPVLGVKVSIGMVGDEGAFEFVLQTAIMKPIRKKDEWEDLARILVDGITQAIQFKYPETALPVQPAPAEEPKK